MNIEQEEIYRQVASAMCASVYSTYCKNPTELQSLLKDALVQSEYLAEEIHKKIHQSRAEDKAKEWTLMHPSEKRYKIVGVDGTHDVYPNKQLLLESDEFASLGDAATMYLIRYPKECDKVSIYDRATNEFIKPNLVIKQLINTKLGYQPKIVDITKGYSMHLLKSRMDRLFDLNNQFDYAVVDIDTDLVKCSTRDQYHP